MCDGIYILFLCVEDVINMVSKWLSLMEICKVEIVVLDGGVVENFKLIRLSSCLMSR